MDTELRQAAQEVLDAMPAGQPRGKNPDWGPEGNKARALYIAARLGRRYEPNCHNCGSDLWDDMIDAAK